MSAVGRTDAERVSDLIGAIYDCALSPARWEHTLDEIRRLLACANCAFGLLDLRTGEVRIEKVIGIEPYWAARMVEYGPDLASLYRTVPGFQNWPIDEPISPTRNGDMTIVHANRYYRDWARPQGLIDAVAVFLMHSRERTAEVGWGRHESVGPVGDREVHILRRLAPHLRRAVTISDLIDVKTLETEAFGSVLDSLAIGIVLVDEDNAIVHANRAATQMIDRGSPIEAVRGKLRAADPIASERLLHLTTAATGDGCAPAGGASGIVLRGKNGGLATAYVLPLARGSLRPRLLPRVSAAVFVASGLQLPFERLEVIADAFGLTPAETRLLERLVQGDSLADAATAMNVAMTTIKTHRSRLLSKTGTRRQTRLISLVHGLVPAIAEAHAASAETAAPSRQR